jgi:hypothetical protein
VTEYWPGRLVEDVPAAKPTTTRASMPIERSITAMAVENCWQKPSFDTVRNSRIERVPARRGVSRL